MKRKKLKTDHIGLSVASSEVPYSVCFLFITSRYTAAKVASALHHHALYDLLCSFLPLGVLPCLVITTSNATAAEKGYCEFNDSR